MDELFLGGFNDFQLMRRFLFWSLCFCLLFPVGLSSCDGSDSAAVIFGGTTGELTWTLTEDGVLTITGEGPMPDYRDGGTSETPPWYPHVNRISSLTIGEGVTRIGDYAFMLCSFVTEVVLEVISMGTLSKLYSNFSDASAKHAVAREFGLNHHKFLRSWLECLAVLRNCCAHHSRLSNRVFPVKPKMPERMPNTWIANFSFREQTLYPQLCYVAYWLNAITSGNTFIANFKQLLAKYPSVNTRLLGFPCNWEQEPLWR